MKESKQTAREWTLWFNSKDEVGGINSKGKYVGDPWVEYVDVIELAAYDEQKQRADELERKLEIAEEAIQRAIDHANNNNNWCLGFLDEALKQIEEIK